PAAVARNEHLVGGFSRSYIAGVVRFTAPAKAEAFPDANLVQFSAYAELGAIPEPQLVQLRDTRRGFAFASPRGHGGYHLIVAGRSSEDILAVIKKMAAVTRLP